MRITRLGSVLAAFVALGCGGGDGPTNNGGNNGGANTCTSTSNAVQVLDNRYSPSCTTVPPGTTVTWTWGGNVANSHTVTFPTGETSPNQTSGTFTRTFAAAGTYTYVCTVHGAAMGGRVVVQ